MTSTKDKLRSVFLVALMVLSVFGGTVALAGTAAAGNAQNITPGGDTGSLAGESLLMMDTIDEGTSYSNYKVNYSVDAVDTADGNTDTFYLNVPNEFASSLSVNNAMIVSSDDSYSVTGTSIVDGSAAVDTDGASDSTMDTIKVTTDTDAGANEEDLTVQFSISFKAPSISGSDQTYSLGAEVVGSDSTSVSTEFTDVLTVTNYPESGRAPGTIYGLPTTVFLGEENVNMGPTAVSEPVQFTGVAGDADGGFVSASDATEVDFTSSAGFSTGGYDVNGMGTDSDDAEVSVRQPQISDMTLYQGAGTGGADVTNARVTTTASTVTVEPEFNFQNADRLEVTVTDEDGLDVTEDVLSSSSSIVVEGDDLYYTGNSGGTFQLDVSNLDTGNYTVEVAGDELDSASHSASFEMSDSDTTISLDKTSAVKGEKVIATVTGTPGDNVFVQVDADDLVDQMPDEEVPTSLDLYDNTGDVVTRDSTGDFFYAEASLGDDGQAKVRIKTAAIEAGSTATIEVAETAGADAEDDVDLSVSEQSISIADAPNRVAVGSDFTINGTASEADKVAAYVKVDDTWYKVPGDTNPDSDLDGSTFELELTADGELKIPGSYRVGLVVLSSDQTAPTDYTNNAWGNLDTTASTTLRTVEGTISADLSRTRIAAVSGDEVTLSGIAVGQSEVDYYVVGPRGAAETSGLSVDDQEYSQDLDDFTNKGVYEIVVVGTGRDGDYKTDPSDVASTINTGSKTQQQALEIIKDRHSGAGVDDVWAQTNLTAESARVTLDVGDQLPQGEVTISGTSNREPDTVYFVELTNQRGNVVASGEGEVTDSGTWNVSLDLSNVDTGMHTLSVEGDDASATKDVEVVESVTTATPTPTTATPTPTTATPTPTTATPTPTTATPTPTEETTTTTGGGPGFGVAVSLVALLGAALIALRRRN